MSLILILLISFDHFFTLNASHLKNFFSHFIFFKLLLASLTAKAEKSDAKGKAGSIVNENFEVCCGEGSIKVLSIQREGKRVQQIKEFLLGTQIKKGTNIA